MSVQVEVGFPVATKTTPKRGKPKFVTGMETLAATFEELDGAKVPVAAVFGAYGHFIYRVDQNGQFFFSLRSPRLLKARYFRPSFGWSNLLPGEVHLSELEQFFNPTESMQLRNMLRKLKCDNLQRMQDSAPGSYDRDIVERQIIAKAEQLQDYVIIDGSLYVKTPEPLFSVLEMGYILPEPHDRRSFLMPRQCYSFHEWDAACTLARRLGTREQDRFPIAMPIPDAFSPSCLDTRVALVNRLFFALFSDYVLNSHLDGVNQLLDACLNEGQLIRSVHKANEQIGKGVMSKFVLDTALRLLNKDDQSVIGKMINGAGENRIVLDSIREEWDNRPIDLQSI